MEKSCAVVVWSKTQRFDIVLNLWCDLMRNSVLYALNWEMLAPWALEGSDPFEVAARSIRASDEILWKCWYVTPIYCQLANERAFGCITIHYQYMCNTTGRLIVCDLMVYMSYLTIFFEIMIQDPTLIGQWSFESHCRPMICMWASAHSCNLTICTILWGGCLWLNLFL